MIPLIIGYGNSLCGDDGFGAAVAEALGVQLSARDARILSRSVLTYELAADIALHSRVIFVDAAVSGSPGSLAFVPIPPKAGPQESTSHGCQPAELLEIVQQLYDRSVPGYLLTCVGESFVVGAALTELVQQGVREACRTICRAVHASNKS